MTNGSLKFARPWQKSEASGATLLLARALIDDAMALEDLGHSMVSTFSCKEPNSYIRARTISGA
jgi:hypothetical protein